MYLLNKGKAIRISQWVGYGKPPQLMVVCFEESWDLNVEPMALSVVQGHEILIQRNLVLKH